VAYGERQQRRGWRELVRNDGCPDRRALALVRSSPALLVSCGLGLGAEPGSPSQGLPYGDERTRAEPGFRPRTRGEVEAERPEWLAGLDARVEAEVRR
jgi:hypothetical protein